MNRVLLGALVVVGAVAVIALPGVIIWLAAGSPSIAELQFAHPNGGEGSECAPGRPMADATCYSTDAGTALGGILGVALMFGAFAAVFLGATGLVTLVRRGFHRHRPINWADGSVSKMCRCGKWLVT